MFGLQRVFGTEARALCARASSMLDRATLFSEVQLLQPGQFVVSLHAWKGETDVL